MEIGTLQHNIGSGVICAATFSTEDSGYAHRFLGIAYAEVVCAQRMLHTIECDKLCPLGLCAYHNLMAGNHVGIETMKRLTVCHHYIIGDVHDVVDRAQTNHFQLVLQPLRAFFHLTSGDAEAGVATTCLGVLYLYIYRKVCIVHDKTAAIGAMQASLISVLPQPGIKIAGHSPMRQGVGAVGRYVHFYQPVTFQIVIFGRRLSHRSVFRQNDDAVVACPHSDFVLGTDHSATFHTAKF